MKKRTEYLAFLVFTFIFISCEKDYFYEGGVTFRVINRTENIYNKANVYIGAVKENDFIVTDSIIFNDVIDKRAGTTELEAFDKTIVDDWRPNLDKITEISSKGVFLFQLSNEEQLFIYPFNFPEAIFNGAILRVYIEEQGLVDYEDPNNEIKQDYEIIK
jgi:hypothetical protein